MLVFFTANLGLQISWMVTREPSGNRYIPSSFRGHPCHSLTFKIPVLQQRYAQQKYNLNNLDAAKTEFLLK
jgi:hypothetical protein